VIGSYLLVVTLGAPYRQAEPPRTHCVRPIHQLVEAIVAPDRSRSSRLVTVLRWKPVANFCSTVAFGSRSPAICSMVKLIERHVAVERLNHPLAIPPRIGPHVILHARPRCRRIAPNPATAAPTSRRSARTASAGLRWRIISARLVVGEEKPQSPPGLWQQCRSGPGTAGGSASFSALRAKVRCRCFRASPAQKPSIGFLTQFRVAHRRSVMSPNWLERPRSWPGLRLSPDYPPPDCSDSMGQNGAIVDPPPDDLTPHWREAAHPAAIRRVFPCTTMPLETSLYSRLDALLPACRAGPEYPPRSASCFRSRRKPLNCAAAPVTAHAPRTEDRSERRARSRSCLPRSPDRSTERTRPMPCVPVSCCWIPFTFYAQNAYLNPSCRMRGSPALVIRLRIGKTTGSCSDYSG